MNLAQLTHCNLTTFKESIHAVLIRWFDWDSMCNNRINSYYINKKIDNYLFVIDPTVSPVKFKSQIVIIKFKNSEYEP